MQTQNIQAIKGKNLLQYISNSNLKKSNKLIHRAVSRVYTAPRYKHYQCLFLTEANLIKRVPSCRRDDFTRLWLSSGQSFRPAAWGSAQWSGNGRGLFERNRFWLACVTRSTAPLIECLFAKSLLVSPQSGPARDTCGVVVRGAGAIPTTKENGHTTGGRGGKKETADTTVSLWVKLTKKRRISRPACLVFPSWTISPRHPSPSSSSSPFSLPFYSPSALHPRPLVADMLFTAWRTWRRRKFGVKGQCHPVSHPLSAPLKWDLPVARSAHDRLFCVRENKVTGNILLKLITWHKWSW